MFLMTKVIDVGRELCARGHEFGATTGRQRRCGWLDLVILNRSFKLNAVSGICLTKAGCS